MLVIIPLASGHDHRRSIGRRTRAQSCAASAELTPCDHVVTIVAVMPKPRRGDVISLVIDDLAFGGEGVGRLDGYVVFVRE